MIMEMEDIVIVSFDKRMRRSPDEVCVGEALLKAKLAFGLTNKVMWTEGLLVFYEVFRYLEEAAARHKGSLVGDVFIDEMRRTEQFEQDLIFHLGPNWKRSYKVRRQVNNYLDHLKKLEKDDPNLLIAYIYHLYMGLASGQILPFRRREPQKNGMPRTTCGYTVTDFSPLSISCLKNQLRENINAAAEQMSETQRTRLIEESSNVFMHNNAIVGSIMNVNNLMKNRLFVISFIILILLYIYFSYTDVDSFFKGSD